MAVDRWIRVTIASIGCCLAGPPDRWIQSRPACLRSLYAMVRMDDS